MNRLAALLTFSFFSLAAWAADPPGRVARLSLVEGEAAVYVDPEVGWEGARVNTHLTSENSVWTEPGSRAELQFGSTALRLGEATQLDILRLDDYAFRGHVTRGTLTVRIRDFHRDESFSVTTPEGRFHFRGNGRFRLETDPARLESLLTVFTGTARLEVAGGTIDIDTGRSVRVTGGDQPRFAFETAYSTPLDDWAFARDQRWEERESLRYVPREMTGWEDLDDYGVWRNDAEYGPVWFPTRVEIGWAPYRYGRWTWVRPWGWAWVDDAPWGYAPFHYGRWVYVGNRWGWYPGRYTARPIWAPALVGWIGGSGWSVSISTGLAGVFGWYPLSPYDYYQPWYAANTTYVTYVNRIVLSDRHRRDHQHDRDGRRHDHREQGATVVPRDQFGTRRPVQNIRALVPGEVVARQPVVAGASVLPTKPQVLAADRAAGRVPAVPAAAPPSAGRVAPTTKPVFPAGTTSGAPVTRLPAPAPSQPAVPVTRLPQAAPSAPAASPARPATPATPVPATGTRAAPPAERPSVQPAQPQAAPRAPAERPSTPATRPAPVPAERAPQPTSRPVPVPAERAPQPATRPAPAPAERAPQPTYRPAPAPAERAPQPTYRPAPAPVERAPQPTYRPAPVERAPQPAARPAPVPVERASPPATRPAAPPAARPAPAPAPSPPVSSQPSRPAPPAEKPASSNERPSSGGEPPVRSGDKPGRG